MKPSYEELEQKLIESERYGRQADITIENLERNVEQLAADNAALKSIQEWAVADVFKTGAKRFESTKAAGFDTDDCLHDAVLVMLSELQTPATDAFLAEVCASGVEEFLRGSQLPYQIATVLADYDNVDDATLQTVIWSGQPPEPDGDVWHLEYVSRGNAIVRAVLKEIRKGVQS
ncbi:TPA: hypothetical protein KE812_001246 [Enterobacter cloacae]|nr:hypothetical protein [Enterobacter cloacae]